ncbi:uroporphyrinogen-III C-methyltransferase [Streptomyces sp. NPDC047002]|uniref:uroporphyrinogen-III C-methyltransferase n=1 Tax=Streptomyces sp. NPDC047002 TaxID=3155475 RepID=UPI003451893E
MTRPQPPYPQTRNRPAVVVGRGPAAAAAASALLGACARVRVVAEAGRDLTPSLADLVARGRVELVADGYRPDVLDGAWVVCPRADTEDENRAVRADARAARVWCLDPRAGQDHGPGPGSVTIVGGGPGDPDLITVRGLRALERADVVVYDRLAPVSLLAGLPASVLLVDAAKVPGGSAMPQREINRHLVEHARLGRRVVRLKGGDPFVFGRGMEEVEACLAAGLAVDVVPGVTSAVGVPGLAGISLTHRGLGYAFTVVSGHLAPDSPLPGPDWAALARSGTTLVLMMAVETLPSITGALLAAGMDPQTPTATVQDGGSPRQTVLRSALGSLAQDAAGVHPPAVTVIGPVAARLADAAWPAPPQKGAATAQYLSVLTGERGGA